MKNLISPLVVALGLAVFLVTGSPASAWDELVVESVSASHADCTASKASCGGCDCLFCRSGLLGDLCGRRQDLAAGGITYQGDITQYYQGVTDGGLAREFQYGAHMDHVINLDMDKLGFWPGFFVKLRAEAQLGQFVNRSAASLIPVNTSGILPGGAEQSAALTNILFTQALSEEFAFFFGKLDTLDGDANAFAHGRGKTQFMNMSLVANPAPFRVVPYSTWGAGFVMLRDGEPIVSFSAIDPRDFATEFNLDEIFAEGVTLSLEVRLPTNFWGLPGHQLFGAAWSSRQTAVVSQIPRLLLPQLGLPVNQSESWALFHNFDQYLVVDPCDSSRGWGIFGRSAVTDAEANPFDWFLSFGIGGSSPICGREKDTFGIGWFRAQSSPNLRGIVLGNHGDGVEFFYNIEVNPWMHVTPDVQIIDPSRRGVDNATLFGLRVKMDF